MYYGADYYPEHWPEERWATDAEMMAEAGLNLVRLAEFAWAKLEPALGRFDFAWLDRAIAALYARGIHVVLGTPTAAPPAWLVRADPQVLRVTAEGKQVHFGFRRSVCLVSAAYREHSRRIVRAMAGHYRDHPAVVGWQIDNEFGCHNSARCYCPACQQAFRAWLRDRYGTLDALNEAWGTVFWSHTYSDWDEIGLPFADVELPNPGLALDYRRFASDANVAYQRLQVEILRELCPSHFVTHNFMAGQFQELNYYDLARDLDFVSWDNYPDYRQSEPVDIAFNHTLIRGWKGLGFWVMEEQSGPPGQNTMSPAPRPGSIRLYSYQAIAHGADAIVYFRWRTATFGAEEYWHGILEHHGKPGRRYAEVQKMGRELQRIGGQIVGAESRAEVALIFDWDTAFAFQVQANNEAYNYIDHLKRYFAALYRRNVPVDVVPWSADLRRYKLVLAPSFYILPEAAAAALRQYVEKGGNVLFDVRTGAKDVYNRVPTVPLPGLVSELCGVTVDEYDSLWPDMKLPLAFDGPHCGDEAPVAHTWCDVLAPQGAKVLARYRGRHYCGQPAATVNQVGRGQALYIGTIGNAAAYDCLFAWLLPRIGVQPLLNAPAGVEVTARWHGQKRLLFVLNHTSAPQNVSLPGECRDLLSGQQLSGAAVLPAKELWILTQ
ncbi:MAG: beta-galactosidase [Anaerolineae bacterium]